jgi:uncharacterized protein YecT (DUF1311 family)
VFRIVEPDILRRPRMMRLLRVSIAIAASLVLLSGCEERARTKTAAARPPDSSLARDLEIAGGKDTAARASDGRDTRAVTQPPGMLDSSRSSSEPALDDGPARTVSDVAPSPTSSTPSAEGYIGPSCASPARDDQQRCLMGYLARSDAHLDRSYQALISSLKSEAATARNAPEPPSVLRLRAAQRSWLVYRDEECRKRTRPREGPLWAPIRAECLAEYSALRARELEDALAKRKASAKREAAKSKQTNGTTSKSRRRGG